MLLFYQFTAERAWQAFKGQCLSMFGTTHSPHYLETGRKCLRHYLQ